MVDGECGMCFGRNSFFHTHYDVKIILYSNGVTPEEVPHRINNDTFVDCCATVDVQRI